MDQNEGELYLVTLLSVGSQHVERLTNRFFIWRVCGPHTELSRLLRRGAGRGVSSRMQNNIMSKKNILGDALLQASPNVSMCFLLCDQPHAKAAPCVKAGTVHAGVMCMSVRAV